MRHTERVSKYIIKLNTIAQIFKKLWWEIIEFILRSQIFFFLSIFLLYLVILLKLNICKSRFFFLTRKNLTKNFKSLSIEYHCFIWETIETLKRFFFCTGNVRRVCLSGTVLFGPQEVQQQVYKKSDTIPLCLHPSPLDFYLSLSHSSEHLLFCLHSFPRLSLCLSLLQL